MNHTELLVQDDVISKFNGLHTDKEIASWVANAQMELTLTSAPQNATALDAQQSDSNEDSSSSE